MRLKGQKRFLGGFAIAGLAFFGIETRIRPALEMWQQQLSTFLGQMALVGSGVPQEYKTLRAFNTSLWVVVLVGLALAAWGWSAKIASYASVGSQTRPVA
jgi:hypothetical protein